ncbi:hypothetical protein GGR54DRAFT_581117 [Hypoxylon sp. NC1633]|nr:hypothetical protein GGR54DRAFT_581117 [Hypoxylon sp. NC1633]
MALLRRHGEEQRVSMGTWTKIIRKPGKTAKSVRWALDDPQPKTREHLRRHGFKHAMAQLEKIVRGRKQSTPQHTLAPPNASQTGVTFNAMPNEIQRMIFEMVNESPSWVHLRFRRGKLVGFTGAANQELLVNHQWYSDQQLRRGISGTPLVGNSKQEKEAMQKHLRELLFKDRKRVRELHDEQSWEELPFFIELKGRIHTPSVKRRTDWFLFDGLVTTDPKNEMWPMPYNMYEIRTCVFMLDDIYEGARSTRNPPLKFLWPTISHIEELVIVVGQFRKEVLPSQMEEIKAYQADDLPVIGKEKIDFGKNISNSENYMMNFITRVLKGGLSAKYRRRLEWLRTQEGMTWLGYPVHDKYNMISKWIATVEGNKWLETDIGLHFLRSQSGWWWLASDVGHPWLESEPGMDWLGTEDGKEFLESEQAILWLNIGTYEPSKLDPLGTQVSKAWFETPGGRAWKFENCPNGNPPSSPPQAPTREAHPEPMERIPSYFINYNFRSWRFVMCPRGEDVEVSYGRMHGHDWYRPMRTEFAIDPITGRRIKGGWSY